MIHGLHWDRVVSCCIGDCIVIDCVSIIVMSYNSMDVICETLGSIMEQNFKGKIEIVISDDGSEEFDREKIEDYLSQRKKNITYFINRNSANLGTVKNINKAIELATNELIINLSAGDMFFNNNILAILVEEYNKHNYNMLCTRRVLFDECTGSHSFIPNDFEIKRINKMNSSEKQYYALLTGMYNIASGSAFSYKKSFVIKMGGFEEEYLLWEDGPFFSKCAYKGIKLQLDYNIISIKYRYGGVSTTKISDKLRKDSIKFLEKNLLNVNKKHIFINRCIKYRIEYLKKNDIGTWKKINLYIKYIDIMIYKIIVKIEKILYMRGRKS